MRRFLYVWVSFVLLLVNAGHALAQTSFAELDQVQGNVVLNGRNPTYTLQVKLPPNPGKASITIKAIPAEKAPPADSLFLLSINQQPALPFAPIIRNFSARFDIPANQLRPGNNQIELTLIAGASRNCLNTNSGGWVLQMRESRFDLALGRPTPRLDQFENWVGADIGAPQKIAIVQGDLDFASYAQFGAQIMQGFGLRMNHIPALINTPKMADLIVRPVLSRAEEPALGIVTQNGAVELHVRAASPSAILEISKWLAENQIPKQIGTGPIKNWPMTPLQLSDPWQKLLSNLVDPNWSPIGRNIGIRLPKPMSARLLVEIERPKIADKQSSLKIFVDGKIIAAPLLWRRNNSLRIDLPATKTSARKLSLVRDFQPRSAANTCAPAHIRPMKNTTRIALQLSAKSDMSALDHLVWNGGKLAKEHGQNTQIILPQKPGPALFASWRILARLAQISGAAYSRAKYNGTFSDQHHGLFIAPRDQLPAQLHAKLPKSFEQGGGHAPGEPYRKYRRINFAPSAFAIEPTAPAIGIAASAQFSKKSTWVVLSADRAGELAPALHDLVNRGALDKFSGTVVRWRGEKIEINATKQNRILPMPPGKLHLWQILMLILIPTGIWSCWQLLWQQKHT